MYRMTVPTLKCYSRRRFGFSLLHSGLMCFVFLRRAKDRHVVVVIVVVVVVNCQQNFDSMNNSHDTQQSKQTWKTNYPTYALLVGQHSEYHDVYNMDVLNGDN